MPAFDQRHRDSSTGFDTDVGQPAVGKLTLVPPIYPDHEAQGTESSETSGPGQGAGEEAGFDYSALAGSMMGGSSQSDLAAAVLEQEPEAEDQVNPDALFDAATEGSPSALPHKPQMEAAFGRPLDEVSAYLGATGPLHAMNADAAARRNQIAFASDNPSPELVSHELTHFEQFRKHGGDGIAASGPVSDPNAASELEAEHVSRQVSAGQQAPEVRATPDAGVQRSFISFAVKMGAKKASKGMLKNFIKTRIKDKIAKLVNKKVLKEIAEEADQVMGLLEDPWWVTAIGFIPVVGDAFDLVNVPMQIRNAIKRADALENKAKRAIELEQQAQRVVRTVKWTAHGGKHVANIKIPWKDVIASTRTGPAKYKHGTDIEALERKVWAEGKKVTNGKTWKVQEFGHEIGASEGKSSRWMRVEESADTIHGHPISEAEFQKLSK